MQQEYKIRARQGKTLWDFVRILAMIAMLQQLILATVLVMASVPFAMEQDIAPVS